MTDSGDDDPPASRQGSLEIGAMLASSFPRTFLNRDFLSLLEDPLVRDAALITLFLYDRDSDWGQAAHKQAWDRISTEFVQSAAINALIPEFFRLAPPGMIGSKGLQTQVLAAIRRNLIRPPLSLGRVNQIVARLTSEATQFPDGSMISLRNFRGRDFSDSKLVRISQSFEVAPIEAVTKQRTSFLHRLRGRLLKARKEQGSARGHGGFASIAEGEQNTGSEILPFAVIGKVDAATENVNEILDLLGPPPSSSIGELKTPPRNPVGAS